MVTVWGHDSTTKTRVRKWNKVLRHAFLFAFVLKHIYTKYGVNLRGLILHLPQHQSVIPMGGFFHLNTIIFMTKIQCKNINVIFSEIYEHNIRMEAFARIKVAEENSFSCLKVVS